MKFNTDSITGLLGLAALTAIAVVPQAEAQAPYSAAGRDASGNRVIVNGLLEGGTGLGSGLYTGWGQTEGAAGMIGTGTAVGNQLNVITTGNYNTVIIDSTQINNGDQTVVLNGELDLQ